MQSGQSDGSVKCLWPSDHFGRQVCGGGMGRKWGACCRVALCLQPCLTELVAPPHPAGPPCVGLPCVHRCMLYIWKGHRDISCQLTLKNDSNLHTHFAGRSLSVFRQPYLQMEPGQVVTAQCRVCPTGTRFLSGQTGHSRTTVLVL